jgi:hypothetical protein
MEIRFSFALHSQPGTIYATMAMGPVSAITRAVAEAHPKARVYRFMLWSGACVPVWGPPFTKPPRNDVDLGS